MGKRDEMTAALRERVLRVAPGELAFVVSQVTEEWGASRGTAQAAIAPLVAEGLLVAYSGADKEALRGRGGGYYRREVPTVRRLASDRLSRSRREQGGAAVGADAETSRLTWVSEMLSIEEAEPPEDVAAILGPAPLLVRRRRIWMGADVGSLEVAQLAADSWIPLDIAEAAPQVRDEDSGPGGIYARIEAAGFRLTRFTEELQARHANPAEVELIQGPPVVVDLTRTAWAGPRAVEVMASTVRAEVFRFSYDFPA